MIPHVLLEASALNKDIACQNCVCAAIVGICNRLQNAHVKPCLGESLAGLDDVAKAVTTL